MAGKRDCFAWREAKSEYWEIGNGVICCFAAGLFTLIKLRGENRKVYKCQ